MGYDGYEKKKADGRSQWPVTLGCTFCACDPLDHAPLLVNSLEDSQF